MWSPLRDEHGLDGEQATRAVVWAAWTLVGALRAGKGLGVGQEQQRPTAPEAD
jgi:hypothetical protein